MGEGGRVVYVCLCEQCDRTQMLSGHSFTPSNIGKTSRCSQKLALEREREEKRHQERTSIYLAGNKTVHN